SRIRSRYREHGARGLVHQMGRPPILSPARLRQARTWAGQGLTHAEIGRKLGMSRSRITELIKQHGVLLTPGTLSGDADDTGAEPAASAPAPAPARAAGEAAMTGPAPRAAGTAGAGGWRRGSSPGRLPAVTRARCWCTPSPAGSAPRAC